MSKLSIEGKPVYTITGFPPLPAGGHLYLVYQNDNGEEFVLRGGPTPTNSEDVFGPVLVSPVLPIWDSADKRIDNSYAVTAEERGNITLSLDGRNVEDVWNLMIQFGNSINEQQFPYNPINGYNSNTVIANLLYLVGIDVNQVLPDFHGITAAGIFNAEYTGKDLEFNFDYTINGTDRKDILIGRGGEQTFIGGGGTDILKGGADNDRLEGGAENDWLDGGQGDDTLIGGEGVDTYIIEGHDTIIDSGENYIFYRGQLIAGVFSSDGSDSTFKANDGRRLVFHSPGRLTLDADDSITFQNQTSADAFADNDFGIYLTEEPIHIYNGDQHGPLVDLNYNWAGTFWAPDGTLVGGVTEENFNDVITGSGEDDQINGLGGNDALDGGEGDDEIKGGDGDDLIGGDTGSDTIYGGAGNDTILSASGLIVPQRVGLNDNWRHYWDVPSGATVRTEGSTWVVVNGVVVFGGESIIQDVDPDAVYADAGDDIVLGGRGDDYIDGGLGNDTLTGHGGNDIINGGDGDDFINGDGRLRPGSPMNLDEAGHGNDFLDGGVGTDRLFGMGKNDVLMGGSGDDYLWGDGQSEADISGAYHGEDYLDGGDGNDQLIGGGKDDSLIGGAGDDLLVGDDSEENLDPQYDGNDSLFGGAGNDELQGGEGDDSLDGGEDDDLLFGQAGNDTLFGGDGNDQLQGGEGEDSLNGGLGDDFLLGDVGDDTLRGNAGNDQLQGGEGNDFLDGGNDDDILLGETGDDTLSGNAGRDQLQGGEGNDFLDGGNDDDILLGEAGDDALSGSAGNDELQGNFGNDTLDGGAGDDLLFGQEGNDILSDDSGNNFLVGGDGDDTLNSGDGNDELQGNAGADSLNGGAGDDRLFGQDGNDLLNDASGNNFLAGGDGDDTLNSGGGNDTLQGDAGNDALNGGAGNDFLLGDAGDDSLLGSIGEDELQGGEGNDSLDGGSDNDLLFGQAGADALFGNDGADELQGGDGDDNLDGGNDNDLLFGQAGADVLFGNDGDDELQGGDDNDSLDGGAGNDFLLGDAGDDTLSGGDGDDELQGNDGNDQLNGGAGNDRLYGKDGDDSLDGGAGDDLLIGGAGNDTLMGGDGDDFYYVEPGEGIKHITDNSGYNILLFGAGITLGMINLSLGSLKISIGNSGNEIHIDNVDYNNLAATSGIREVRFADGQSLTIAQLLSTLSIDIHGGEQNDTLTGTSAGDLLSGLDGDDRLLGNDGDDTLDGGAGNDVLEGGVGQDVLRGDAGDDQLLGNGGDDTLDGGAGNDVLDGGAGNDVLDGGAGQNLLRGDAGDDQLLGNDGDDTLDGGAGNDVLDGGAGQDLLRGDAGDDTYLNISSEDTVYDYDGRSLFVFNQATGLAQANALSITDGESSVHVTLDDGTTFTLSYGMSADLQFAGGTTLDWETLLGAAITDTLLTPLNLYLSDNGGRLYGAAGDDVLYGGAGNDTLIGHRGNDTLQGGAGDDVYQYGLGDGTDTLVETGGDHDVLRFNAGILAQDMKLTRWQSGGDSLRLYTSANDYVQIQNYFLSSSSVNRIERIEFADGTVWDYAAIKAAILKATEDGDTLTGFADNDVIDGRGGNDAINGKAGDDVLQGGSGDDDIQGGVGNDTLEGGAGNDRLLGYGKWANDLSDAVNDAGIDVLYGGAGNDRMDGGKGADLYLFGLWDGYDYVEDSGTDNGIDTLRLGAGIRPEDITIYAQYNSPTGRILLLNGSSTQVDFSGIESIEFDDGAGPVWLMEDIIAHTETTLANTMTGTAGDDLFSVDNTGDIIAELIGGGVDTVQASRSYTLSDNIENLTLMGLLNINATGNATGNALDNTLIGNAGGNILDGKGGYNDSAYGGQGNDWYINVEQIVENTGEGIDTWISRLGGVLPDNVENLFMGYLNKGWTAPGEPGSSYYSYINSAFSGTAIGNALDNIITSPGNGSRENIIDGKAGADTAIIIGGDKVSVYIDNPGDKIIGVATLIWSSIDYALAPARLFANSTVYDASSATKNLTLFGTDTISGSGNALNNVLDSSQNQAANTLSGGAGNDTYIIGNNDHVIEAAGEGTDTAQIYTSASDSGSEINIADLGFDNVERYVLIGQANNTTLRGNALDNDLSLAFDEGLYSYSGHFGFLLGEGGNDRLFGGATNDVLNGGTGADVMQGGGGNDVYIVDNMGDQVISGGGYDTVEAGISFTLSDYIERLTLTGSAAINGTGNALSNQLTGNSAANSLFGAADNDQLDGRAGDDYLEGGEGNDRYFFGIGSGQDTVNNYDVTVGKTDTVYLQAIAPSGIQLSRSGDDLLLSISGTTDTLTIHNYLINEGVNAYTVEQIQFGADGTVWDVNTVMAVLNNHAPVLASALPDQTVAEGASFNFSLPPGAFTDPDSSDTLTYSATLADGSALPSWLSFDALTRTFRGTPPVSGTVSVRVTANDMYGLSATDSFNIIATVQNLTLTGTATADTLIGGSGNDNLSGLGGNDTLIGNAGNDQLDGGTGNDNLQGGLGDDAYVVDSTSDVVTENANEGIDSVYSSVTRTLGANSENLILTGSTAINGTGNTLNNILTGNSTANTLTGGAGDDTYVIGTNDSVVEAASAGTDTVQSSITYTLANNVENLILLGTTAINGTGNTLNNVLTGNSAANTLSGGSGADSLIGGAGDDTYVVDSTADTVTELLGEGSDLVQSGVTYTLAANVDNLTLTGTTAINGSGNVLDNVLTGNSAANTLTGDAGNDRLVGGAGADTLRGGAGNDSYVIDVTTDIITENLNEGIDTVESAITYTLSAANVENLTLTGTSAINGTGNSLNNLLTGNSAANTLTGGAGDDTYVIGTGDSVVEAASAGIDTVQSSITYTLTNNVENLSLTGTTALNGTGNTLNNILTGNSAANTLSGSGGNDSLSGGLGADSFVFDAVLSASSNNDIITDFSVVDDTIKLENAVFAKFTTTGALAAGSFVSGAGAVALDSNDYLIYDSSDGSLYYDADGNGAGARVEFVSLTGNPALTAADFVII